MYLGSSSRVQLVFYRLLEHSRRRGWIVRNWWHFFALRPGLKLHLYPTLKLEAGTSGLIRLWERISEVEGSPAGVDGPRQSCPVLGFRNQLPVLDPTINQQFLA